MVIGRDAERVRIDVGAVGHRVLVVSGEPGIGKTALLEDACASAEGMRVLRATGVESESALAFAGFHALLRPVLDLLPASRSPRNVRSAPHWRSRARTSSTSWP